MTLSSLKPCEKKTQSSPWARASLRSPWLWSSPRCFSHQFLQSDLQLEWGQRWRLENSRKPGWTKKKKKKKNVIVKNTHDLPEKKVTILKEDPLTFVTTVPFSRLTLMSSPMISFGFLVILTSNMLNFTCALAGRGVLEGLAEAAVAVPGKGLTTG